MEPASMVMAAASLLRGLMLLVSYISNGNTFPQPLPEGEERMYLERLEQGDEHARNVLIERNLRLVAHIVKKFDNTAEDTDDLISVGTIGLIKAVATFDRSRGTRLATYAARCIENEILMQLRSSKNNWAEVSLSDSIGVDKEGNEITLVDVLGTEPDTVAEQVEASFEQNSLYEKIKVLNKRERKVLSLRYGLPGGVRKTQREIAKLLGISRSYVSRIEKKAVNKLQKELSLETGQ